MSKQVEWDALVNARSAQLQAGIDRLQTEKDAIDARITAMAGGSNDDVTALRDELTAQSNRLGSRITNQSTQKTAVDARLYASLSAGAQAIVDDVCTNRSLHVQTMLAHSDVDIEAMSTRYETARTSVTTPPAGGDNCCKLMAQVIQRMVQGL